MCWTSPYEVFLFRLTCSPYKILSRLKWASSYWTMWLVHRNSQSIGPDTALSKKIFSLNQGNMTSRLRGGHTSTFFSMLELWFPMAFSAYYVSNRALHESTDQLPILNMLDAQASFIIEHFLPQPIFLHPSSVRYNTPCTWIFFTIQPYLSIKPRLIFSSCITNNWGWRSRWHKRWVI